MREAVRVMDGTRGKRLRMIKEMDPIQGPSTYEKWSQKEIYGPYLFQDGRRPKF